MSEKKRRTYETMARDPFEGIPKTVGIHKILYGQLVHWVVVLHIGQTCFLFAVNRCDVPIRFERDWAELPILVGQIVQIVQIPYYEPRGPTRNGFGQSFAKPHIHSYPAAWGYVCHIPAL